MFSILFIFHIPPPVHGSSIVGSYIKNSTLINKKFSSDYINLSTSRKLNEIGKYNFSKVSRLISILFDIVSKNFKMSYDLCYLAIAINGKAFYRDLIIVFLLKLFGNKIVLHLHNKGASSFNNIFRKLGYRYVFNNTKVILLSGLLYSDIEKYVKKEQVYVCPNGILNNTYKRITQKKNDCISLLFLSNMMQMKGVFFLLQACKKLNERKIKFICNFVGGWKDITKNEIFSFIKENSLQDMVQIHGPKYGDDKIVYFQKADILIHPTLEDCFPLNLLEAMSYSLPIVSTFEGGIPDIVIDGETGFLCPQKDVDCLVEKIELLINNPDLRTKMGKAGRKRFEENFTLERFERRFTEIIEKIVNE